MPFEHQKHVQSTSTGTKSNEEKRVAEPRRRSSAICLVQRFKFLSHDLNRLFLGTQQAVLLTNLRKCSCFE